MKWMPSCKETAQLFSDSLDRELPWLQKAVLKMHLSMCQQCKAYTQQLLQLRETFQHLGHHSQEDTPPLPESTRRKILDAVKAEKGSL